MKLKTLIIVLLLFSCTNKKTENQAAKENKTETIITNEKSKYPYDIFEDKFFSFIALEHVFSNIAHRDSLKKFTKEHYDFFRTKEEWHDAGCYLIAKQSKIGSVTPVINYICDPFDFIGQLFTLDSNYNKIDSLVVFGESWSSGGDGPYEGNSETESFFKDNIIKTKITIFVWIRDQDTTVIDDSLLIFHHIEPNGKIIKDSEKKYDVTNVP